MNTAAYSILLISCLTIGLCLVLTVTVKTNGFSMYDKHTMNRLQDEHLEHNLKPHRHRRYIILAKSTENDTEECSSSEDDFPQFILTDEQVKNGGIVLVAFIGIYCFTLLAIVCDNYFLPSVERICETLNLSPDVAAATFMSVATTTPELFTNIIGTFILESDIGIGTVVGSSMFNSLGVAAVGGLAASSPIQLHWWPVTRDIIIYICAILLLVEITWDGTIYWYEGLILFIVYFIYFTIMFNNVRISNFLRKLVTRNNKVVDVDDCEKAPSTVTSPPGRGSLAVVSSYGSYAEDIVAKYPSDTKNLSIEKNEEEEEPSLFRLPKGSFLKKAFFYYTWPLKFVLLCTVPDPKKYPKVFPISFILCIVWIGLNSYIVSWMITIIGNIFNIPDAVLGLTFLAAGGCLPEATSITIMSRRGEGSFGVSNSLGANTMNILLSLGMPWFLKTITMGAKDSSNIVIESGSLEYTISALVVVACILYITLYINKFRLSRKVGFILISIYTVCIVLAILAEMVFFDSESCVEE